MMGFVLVREDGQYVAPAGSVRSYTFSIVRARKFDTREAAEADRCGNESIEMANSLRSKYGLFSE